MSEAVSTLGGIAWADGIADIREVGPQGMITLRGDLTSAEVNAAARGVASVEIPGVRAVNAMDDRGICWMSPDEVLVLCPYGEVEVALSNMQAALGSAHALAVNVSDARAVFEVSGSRAREVLAKLCPVDFAPDRFTPGQFRRTRLAQVAAAVWMRAPDTFGIICFRSVAGYVFDVLTLAAQPGSEVDYFQS